MKINTQQLEKADLHIHLNGAIPTEIIRELLVSNNISLPNNFDLENDLQVLKPAKSLLEYFKPWIAFKSLPIGYDMLYKMVHGAFKKLKSDNVKYVEFRNSPFYISKLNNISIHKALEWLTQAISLNSNIFMIEARLIISITRHEFDYDESLKLLKAIDRVDKNIIVGIDMSGNEDIQIDTRIVNIFRRAKDEYGLGITMHAGETGNEDNIRWAINDCLVDRIGHGTAAIKSDSVLELILKKDICLEVSMISNIRTSSVRNIKQHPVKTFVEKKIPFVFCTDNPSVHQNTLSDEYELFLSEVGKQEIILDMFERQNKYSFKNKGRIK